MEVQKLNAQRGLSYNGLSPEDLREQPDYYLKFFKDNLEKNEKEKSCLEKLLDFVKTKGFN
jgi:hypothetical protein